MNHYTHLYGSTVINANRIRSMVNLTLEACVRYLLYIVIYCKQVHYTADSLVWGSLRLAPIIINANQCHYAKQSSLLLIIEGGKTKGTTVQRKILMGRNFDVFDTFQLDRQYLTHQIVQHLQVYSERQSPFIKYLKSQYPSKFPPVKILRYTV